MTSVIGISPAVVSLHRICRAGDYCLGSVTKFQELDAVVPKFQFINYLSVVLRSYVLASTLLHSFTDV